MFKYQLEEYEKAPDKFNYEVTLKKKGITVFGYRITDDWIIRVFGYGTVWHYLPGMQRCGIFMEGFMSEIFHQIQYKESQEK